MKRIVLIVAGGKGLRMGSDLPKQFIPFNGKPLLMHTLNAFYRWDPFAVLLLVLPNNHRSYWEMLCKETGCEVAHHVVDGGETRFHSVCNGLDYVRRELLSSIFDLQDLLIGVHDGVRPFVSTKTIEKCFAKAEQQLAALPVVPVIDSIRETDGDESCPVDRSRYVLVQTPQVFRADILFNAYTQAYDPVFTDDASVVETSGVVVHTVEGNRENIKITTPFDLQIAKALFAQTE